MNNNLIKTAGPTQVLIGALVFLFPFLSLITRFGVGLSSFAFLIAALFFLKPGVAALRRHWRDVRWVVYAFLANFVFALLCLVFRDESLGVLEKPSRMLFALSAAMVVLAVKPDRKALWWGVIGGALGGMLLVGYQFIWLDIERPGGLINAITFGDLSLLLGLLSLTAALDLRATGRAVWPTIGAVAGLAGSIMTGSRGGWLALVPAAILFAMYAHVLSSRRVRALILLSFALMFGAYFVPHTEVRDRVNQGIVDVETYYAGGSAFSNLGVRLELWKAASMVIADRPLLGQGAAGLRAALSGYVGQGRLDPVVLPAEHLHNDALHSLAVSGIPGLLAWLGILVAPYLFFARSLRGAAHPGRLRVALALAGMLVVIGYFSFGLTEVIFWSVKGSLFYALMIFLLMGFCLNAKENDGK